MSRNILKTIVILLALLLAAGIGFIAYMEMGGSEITSPTTMPTTVPATTAAETVAPTTQAPTTEVPTTQAPATEATEVPTSAPVETTVPPETTVPAETTEPGDGTERFLLTFVGDCTLGSTPKQYGVKYSFIDTIGENYDYPFANVVEYFKKDDFTMANFEGTLTDEKMYSDQQFPFKGPTAYTQILTGSSVEAVTLANNHTRDFGTKGYNSTKSALDEAKLTYVEKDNYQMFTTESGLKIGLYGASFTMNQGSMATAIANMRSKGAEVVIVAFHWGSEGVYRPSDEQVRMAHDAVKAGADIVYGHHPHVLQKIEKYQDSIIYYSLGNFSFGGNNWPQDLDTAILQQEVIRDENGKISLGELTIIPASCSSLPVQNNFQPTPYEEGSEQYKRVLSKLDGTFKGGNLIVDYTPEETKAPATEAPVPEAPATEAPETAAPTVAPPVETQAPETPAPEPPATEAPIPEGPVPTIAPTPDVPDWEDPQT